MDWPGVRSEAYGVFTAALLLVLPTIGESQALAQPVLLQWKLSGRQPVVFSSYRSMRVDSGISLNHPARIAEFRQRLRMSPRDCSTLESESICNVVFQELEQSFFLGPDSGTAYGNRTTVPSRGTINIRISANGEITAGINDQGPGKPHVGNFIDEFNHLLLARFPSHSVGIGESWPVELGWSDDQGSSKLSATVTLDSVTVSQPGRIAYLSFAGHRHLLVNRQWEAVADDNMHGAILWDVDRGMPLRAWTEIESRGVTSSTKTNEIEFVRSTTIILDVSPADSIQPQP